MSDRSDSSAPIIVGWEEWLALPDLGLPAIRAKIDTGAKTSALHAFAIELYGPAAAPLVRFGVHPVPGREDIVRYCTAAVADRREVTSSNGEKEVRFVIRTRLVLADRDWGEIETTLANRESMAYRMLLGRQAIRSGMLVDPAASFLQSKLSHRLYAGLPRQTAPHRRIRIAVISSSPERPSNSLLSEEAERRGHLLDILPLAGLDLDYGTGGPRLLSGGQPLPGYDAVVTRATGGPPGLAAAAVRHLQQAGAIALNGADEIERVRNPYLVASLLYSRGLPPRPAPRAEAQCRCLVIQGRTEARRGDAGASAERLAGRVADALGLGLVAIDIAGAEPDLRIAGIDLNPALTGFGQARRIAQAVIAAVETRLRSPVTLLPSDADG